MKTLAHRILVATLSVQLNAFLAPGVAGHELEARKFSPPDAAYQKVLEFSSSFFKGEVLLSADLLEKEFPANYQASTCEENYVACSYDSRSDRDQAVSLIGFQVRNPKRPDKYRTSATFVLHSDPCLKREQVDEYLGTAAKVPSIQPGWLILSGDEEFPFRMEYENDSELSAKIFADILILKHCVIQIRIQSYSRSL